MCSLNMFSFSYVAFPQEQNLREKYRSICLGDAGRSRGGGRKEAREEEDAQLSQPPQWAAGVRPTGNSENDPA